MAIELAIPAWSNGRLQVAMVFRALWEPTVQEERGCQSQQEFSIDVQGGKSNRLFPKDMTYSKHTGPDT